MNKYNFELLIATQNKGKISELENLLEDVPVQLRSLRDFPTIEEPEESGTTFAENAVLKARYYALQTGIDALADDSGLEVEALNGAPGIFSARYAGITASDQTRTNKILDEMRQTDDSNRRARFVCAAALTDKNGKSKFVEQGFCYGSIAQSPRGANGFGYDPIFIPDGFTETFGELSIEIKQRLSHRAQAISKIIQQMRQFYASLT